MSLSNLFWDLVVHNIFKISTLSTEDYVNIVASYGHAASGYKAEVDPTLLSRGYTAEALALTKKIAPTVFTPVTSCGLRFTKHLSKFKYPLFGYALVLFENYERGQLPFEGSVADQPAQVMELFALLQNLRNERELSLIKKQEQHGRHQRKDSVRTR